MKTGIKLQTKFYAGISFLIIILLAGCMDDHLSTEAETLDGNYLESTSNRSSLERIVFGDYTISEDGCCIELLVFTDYDIGPHNVPIHQIDIFNDNGDLLGSVFHGEEFGNNWIPNPDPDSPYQWGWVLEWCGCNGSYCFVPNIIGGEENQPRQGRDTEVCIEITECSGPCESAGLSYDSENCILSWEDCPGWNATLIGPKGQEITENPYNIPEGTSGVYSLTYNHNHGCDPMVFELNVDCSGCETELCESAGLNYDSENCILSWDDCPDWNSTLIGPNGEVITENPYNIPQGTSGVYSLTYNFNRDCNPVVYQHNVECVDCIPQISQDYIIMEQITSNCRYVVRAKWNVDNCDCCDFGNVDHFVIMEAFDESRNLIGTNQYTQHSGTCDLSGMSAVGYWNLNSSSFLEVCNFDLGDKITFVVTLELIDDGDCNVNGYTDTMAMEYTVDQVELCDCECECADCDCEP